MGSLNRRLSGRPLVPGHGRGPALTTTEPLSLWGGLDPATGEVIDRRHPLSGRLARGRVLVLPHGRGSCSASGVLLEAIRNGSAPAGVIVSRIDPIIGLGAILGDELYDRRVPVVLLSPADRAELNDDDDLVIEPDGSVTILGARTSEPSPRSGAVLASAEGA